MYERARRPKRGMGDAYLSSPRGSVRRISMGDGPVTSPDQDPTTGEIQMPDDYVGGGTTTGFDSGSSTTVATVGPTITPTTSSTSPVDSVKNAVTDAADSITTIITGAPPTATGPNIGLYVLLAGVGATIYYFTKKPKKPQLARR